MYTNKMKQYRNSKNITLKELSDITGISTRIFVSFRKRNEKKSIHKGYETYLKKTWSIRNRYFF